MPDSAEQIFAKAIELHQRGALAQAESLYRQVLQAVPLHLDSLNLLGLVAMQTGRNELAIELFGKAIAANGRIADFHNNIGEAFRRSGNLERAVDHFTKAATLEPTFLEARQNLGEALRAQGRWDRAATVYSEILALKPGFAPAHGGLADVLRHQGRLDDALVHLEQAPGSRSARAFNEIGITLREQGRLDDAIAQFRRAASLDQALAEAHNNLGNALREKGQLEPAAAALARAIELKPDFASALHNLALVRLAGGRPEEALALATRALELHEGREIKAVFVQCLKARPSLGEAVALRPLLLRALSEPWARSNELVNAAECGIKADAAVKRLLGRIGAAAPDLQSPELDTLAADELLTCLLTSAPVSDFALEQLLTRSRSALLELVAGTADDIMDGRRLGFMSALARQCFINDYVFMDSERERARLAALGNRLEAAVRTRAAVPVPALLAIACYQPLHSLACAGELVAMVWPAPVDAVLTQQIREPAAARQHQATLPRLTAIEPGVSTLVRQQYEENPYPCWVKAAPGDEWPTIDAYLRALFPNVPLDGTSGQGGEILIAGCGTGQQSFEVAQRFPHAHVLAIDMSLASLGFAKMRAASLPNLEHAQADILALGTVGRSFDLIEATGVLHHLADPMAGWRVLLSLLRPGGFMRLGLYSKLGRHEVEAARAWISQHGYRAVPDDIRRCRQEMMASEVGTTLARVTRSPDFASTSACRDLLFHVQEHQLTLREIERFLVEENLVLLGFELESNILERYRSRFPQDVELTRLDNWHQFETENPYTFARMYQFWIQKPRR